MVLSRPRKNGSDPERPGTLAISKHGSSEWRKVAQMPEAEFERLLSNVDRPTLGALIDEWYRAKPRRWASLEWMAAELRAAGWNVIPPADDGA